jgi:hypothetical protein
LLRAALGIEALCRVSDKKHSAKRLALGNVAVSRSGRLLSPPDGLCQDPSLLAPRFFIEAASGAAGACVSWRDRKYKEDAGQSLCAH